MSEAKKVTVIGLRPMGQSTVKSLVGEGYEITVWNRSPDKADASEEVGVDATLSHAAQSIWRRALDASDERGEVVTTYRLMCGD